MKFGIREAQKAAVFAKTKEQKDTVLAVVSMLNIPVVLNQQVNKQAKKLNAKINYDNTLVAKLKAKVQTAENLVTKHVNEKKLIATTSVDWS